MKKRGIRSSDLADSLCLTHAYPLSALDDSMESSKKAATILQKQKSSLKARGNLYGGNSNS